MNKFLLASVALFAIAGAAGAQEAPAFYGNYEANVLNSDGSQTSGTLRSTITSGQANSTVPTTSPTRDGFNVHANQNYSGK